MAATMVQAGIPGVWNVLSGGHNLLEAFSIGPNSRHLRDDLGTFFEVTSTAIKLYTVGYPIHSILNALFTIMRRA